MSPLPAPAPSGSAGERETHGVNALPPPPPPPPGGRQQPVPRPSGSSEWDWDRVQDLARHWYQPLLDRESWMAAFYLFLGMVSAVGFFIALNVVGWVTFGLLFAGIGIFLIRPFFAMVEALAGVERRMPEMIGVHVEPRPIRPMSGLGLRAVADPERWRQVGFLALNIVIATTIGNLGLAAYFVAPQVAFTDPFSGGWLGLGPIAWVAGLALAAVLLGAAPRIAMFVARFKAQVTAWFLGVDRLAEAQERVSTLAIPATGHPRRRRQRAPPHRTQPARRRAAATGRDRSRPRHGRATPRRPIPTVCAN